MSVRPETAVESAVFAFLHEMFLWDRRPRALVVAFSGGPDSTALLWSLIRCVRAAVGRGRPDLRLVAAHLDHGLDPRSADRADSAVRLARLLGLLDDDIRSARLDSTAADPVASTGAREGGEAWARRRRYAFLRDIATTEDAHVVLTAHHADDQAETVALRLLYGSGLRGLAGIRPSRDLGTGGFGGQGPRLMRPLLSLSRRDIERALDVARSEVPALLPLEDPSNADHVQPRALLRHHLLPRLRTVEPRADESMCRVAAAARRFGDRLDDWFERRLTPRSSTASPGSPGFAFVAPPDLAVHLDAYLDLTPELQRHALAFLHARAGRPYPPAASAMAELARQLRAHRSGGGEVGVDCGDGLRWCVVGGPEGKHLRLQERIPPRSFTYTFQAPGVVDVPEIFLSLRCEPSEPRPFMYRGEVLRTGLALPPDVRPTAVVRTRRAGDRLRPLGAAGTRRLKEVLIDRKVPRAVRDRLPLLWLDGILAWVPGVTVDERFRLTADIPNQRTWIAEIRPWPANESSSRMDLRQD